MSSFIRAGLNVLIDGQWGSTGKGKLGGWIGSHHAVDLACSSFGPNAGHTHVSDAGVSTVFKIMPSTAITAKCPVLIMPDSVIDLERFWLEVKDIRQQVFVHPNTAVLSETDKTAAQETGRWIAGTMQGTGHALSRKILRLQGVRLAKDVLPASFIKDTCAEVQACVEHGGTVVFEMSQGFDLSLNHGHSYPFVTSRDISIGTCLNSAGIPPKYLASVIGSIRTFPIRVGNIAGGYSGPCYPDQQEITWADVARWGDGPSDLEEKTTVTKRVRRVFSFSLMQLEKFVRYNNPDVLFLNFAQYLDWKVHEARTAEQFTPTVSDFINNIEHNCGAFVWLVGTGAKESDMVER